MHFKRVFDVAAALIGLLLLGALLPFLFVLIRLDGGPVFFSQLRVGRSHRLFRCYKLRTMRVDAEALAQQFADKELFIQRENDPRVTRVGRVLRALSIDELPQFYNVLRGDMSLIGPRPLVLAESNRLPSRALARYDVRPGLSGLAQLHERGNADEHQRADADIFYVRNVSFMLDLKLFFRTLLAIALMRNNGV